MFTETKPIIFIYTIPVHYYRNPSKYKSPSSPNKEIHVLSPESCFHRDSIILPTTTLLLPLWNHCKQACYNL